MKRAADALYLLASTSIKAGYVSKALIYTDFAIRFFPEDERIVAIRAFNLLLAGDHEASEEKLKSFDSSSKDVDLIKARNSILLNLPIEEQRDRVRKYLTQG